MRNILIYVTLFLAWSLSSCNDWLDVKPETERDEEEMFDSPNGFKNALTACYIKMNSENLYGKRLTVTDIEFMAQHWTWSESNYSNERKLKDFNYEDDYPKDFFSAVYGELYNIIVQANIILKNIPEKKEVIVNEDVRALVEGEALAIRAFCHMEILRLFGQIPQIAMKQVSVPYAKTVSTDAIPYYAFSDFVNLIVQDIDAAEALFKDRDPLFEYTYEELDNFSNTKEYDVTLDDDFLGYRRFRFNYYAMKAMKARLYMYTGDKAKAYAAAMEVINAVDKKGNKVLTLAGTADMNKKNYALPSECILALSNYELEKNVTELFRDSNPLKLYLTDKQFTQDIFAGQSTSINNRAQVWNTDPDNQGNIKPTPKKYNQPTSDDNTDIGELASQKQVIPLIRLSEMYLIAMESATSLSDVNFLYTEYMKARGVAANPLTEEQVMTEIVREYRREFFAEGQMFYTYKRLGIKNMLWKTDREVGEQDYVAPLPATEYNANQK